MYSVVYSGTYRNQKVLIKTNSAVDVNLTHEYQVMRKLNACKPLKSFFSQPIDFRLQEKRQCLIMNYIKNEGSLYDCMDDLNRHEKENIYHHLCYMLLMAQEMCQFTHYDLNFDNILLIKPIKKQRNYALKNRPIKSLAFLKFQPVIIDMGFSHCRGVSGLNAPVTQTHHYMNPMVFCPYFDFHMLQRDFDDNGLSFPLSRIARPRPKKDPLMPKLVRGKDERYILHTSLFDFLTRITGCATYEREEPSVIPNDDEDEWEDIDSWTSVQRIRETQLYTALQTMSPNLERVYRQSIDFDDPKLASVLMFWIDIYKKTYAKFNIFNQKFIDSLQTTVY